MNVKSKKIHDTKIKLPIFLDYQSTTKLDPRVLEVMIPYLVNSVMHTLAAIHLVGLLKKQWKKQGNTSLIW
jgi:cysteine sulfinate desulfinase/cysteine desulfurase-like protein